MEQSESELKMELTKQLLLFLTYEHNTVSEFFKQMLNVVNKCLTGANMSNKEFLAKLVFDLDTLDGAHWAYQVIMDKYKDKLVDYRGE